MITHNAFTFIGIQDKELNISNLIAFFYRHEIGIGIYLF